jgi:hypothetical protein
MNARVPTRKSTKPTGPMVVLAAALAQRKPFLTGSFAASADEVADRLSRFGFELTAQQTSAHLSRLARLDRPPVVVLRGCVPWNEYRVTGFGRTWVQDMLGLHLHGEFPHPSEIAGADAMERYEGEGR